MSPKMIINYSMQSQDCVGSRI